MDEASERPIAIGFWGIAGGLIGVKGVSVNIVNNLVTFEVTSNPEVCITDVAGVEGNRSREDTADLIF